MMILDSGFYFFGPPCKYYRMPTRFLYKTTRCLRLLVVAGEGRI